MNRKQLAFVLVLAAVPSAGDGAKAATARASLKAPIQPDAVPVAEDSGKSHRPRSTSAAKPATKKPTVTLGRQGKQRAKAEVPGQLSFSTFAVGGRVSEPRVTFELEPIPLEMVDEPFALDYQQRVKDSVVKKDLDL